MRELENAVSRGILRASGRVALGEPVLVQRSDVTVDGAPAAPADEPAPAAPLAGRTLHEAVQDYRRELIQAALRRADGNWSAAARELGMHRSNLHHLAQRLGLR